MSVMNDLSQQSFFYFCNVAEILFFWQKTQMVVLRHDGRVIRGTVLYATPKGVPYDIAVIVSRLIADILPCQISDITHLPGK